MKVVCLFFVATALAAIGGMFALSVRWFLADASGAYAGFFGAFFLSAICAALVAAYLADRQEYV